jgi:hypothetical protein
MLVLVADSVIVRDQGEKQMAVSVPQITTEHVRAFRDDGFFVLESVLPHTEVELLRGECQRFIDERDREMDRLGVDTLDLERRGSRYFVHAYGKSADIERFLRHGTRLQ